MNSSLPVRGSAGRVLVVDDEPQNLLVAEGLLTPLGYDVVTAADGLTALAMVAADPPDVVLLDVMMPGLDGFEVCRRLKSDAATALVPVVMVTALDAATHRVRGLEVGADDFMTKPIVDVEIRARVRSMAARSELQRRLHSTETVLRTIATAIEVRDGCTGDHVARLRTNAGQLARALELSSGDTASLEWAAVLHDVGKIGVPDRVLLKPGRLDEDEWELMRAHAALGERIVRPLAGFEAVVPVVRHHHERWDGTGYPDRLAGPDIPFLARAFQLLDIFDALTSRRPYKRALSLDEALGIMRAERGGVTDPELYDVFEAQVAERLVVDGAVAV